MISSDHTTLMYIQGKYFLNNIDASQTNLNNEPKCKVGIDSFDKFTDG